MGRVLFRVFILVVIAFHVSQWRLRKDRSDGLCLRPPDRRGPSFGASGSVSGCRFPARNPSVVADGRWVFLPLAKPPVETPGHSRAQARAWIERALPQWPGARGLALAVWLGETSGLPEGMARLYLEGGLLHLLALSGQHVASLWLLIHGSLSWGAGLANRHRWSRALYPFAHAYLPLVAAAILLVLNPGNQPMARAAGMLAAYRLLRVRGLRSGPIQLACTCLALLLVFSPERVASDSFLLSGLATVLLCAWIENAGQGSPVATYVSLSWAMPVLLLPISAYFFGQVAWTAPVNGLVLGWTWSLLWVPWGFLAPVVGSLPGSASGMAGAEQLWLWFAASNVSAGPWVAWGYQPVWRPNGWETLALEALCIALVFGARNALRRKLLRHE